MLQPRDKLSPTIAAAQATAPVQAAAYPLDTLRRRMQMSGSLGQAKQYASYRDCIRSMIRDEGWASLYRGVGVNRHAPMAAMEGEGQSGDCCT